MNTTTYPLSETAAAVTPPAAPRYRVWPVDAARFSSHGVQALRHNFHEHPLMQLPALERLAKDLLPTEQCRFLAPGTTQASAFDHRSAPVDGRDIEAVFRRIEEPGSWIALYNVQTDPLYDTFVNEVIATVKPLIDIEQPGIFGVSGFIFISAPPSVTPFHIDRENNFWLQVRGRKVINVWDPTDREAVPAEQVEDFIVHGDLERVRLREELRARSHEFDTGPGDGVYFPSTSPHMTKSDRHWVRPGDGVAISIGVVFYTACTRAKAHAYAFNRLLRRAGFVPREPGIRNPIKSMLGKAVVRAQSALRGYQPRKGF